MRRGQEGSRAASIIGIITLLFIFYIVFLPPETRMKLLEGNITDEGGEYEDILLSETIGELLPEGKQKYDHTIPNLYLTETRESVILARENPFTITKGIFGEDKKESRFTITDLENTENIILSFQALTRKGILHIALNGIPILESPIMIQNPPPIILPKNMLQETNTLTFSVTGGFLQTKQYSLTDIKIIGDITDIKKQEATNTFSITKTEHDHIETSYLDFYPICEQAYVGIMTITLNGKIIYSAVPACQSTNRQELYREDLRTGKNTITFQISQGQYRIEQIKIRNTVEEMKSYVAFFDINEDLNYDIERGTADIILEIEFVGQKRKQAELNINGRYRSIDQKDNKYTRDITELLREGNNYIEITPTTELNIPRLQVRVE